MEIVTSSLIIIIYLLLIAFLIIAILIGLKFLNILTKTDKIIENINSKLETLNPIFDFIDHTSTSVRALVIRITELKDKLLNKFRI